MRRTSSLIARLAAVALIAGVSGACVVGEEFQRGYLLDEQAFASVKPGQDAQQVLQILGTPSTVSTVGNRSWYYISQRSTRRVQFMNDTVVDQRVAAVYFTKNLKVERVALYGLQDGRVFDFVSRTTPTGGSDQNFVGQLFRGVASLNPFGS
ncbi:outer membrane protein assembly factor BamE [Salinarimonas soli]|uniref:Outer membrane protein assembly factor BamE n=1 Tax=Salinarimonas soli TaxID=1638099 RepID=A0A5B2VHJ9_9HYPH|nr:outer membrane protein assembly factor BamE [Salinarimonas soli]KAA2238016.1 outer membrane protein assembly factor BamE [Salinarimonas soli]